ncbi:MAG: glycosyltransferase family 4 protein [Planctomycetota bacterium]|nr:glycosyltransferase family 4 protein [Planctomycetota bacterium]
MSSPLTIAHVDSEKGWSGGQVQVFLLMEGLRARGHRNVLFCPPGSRQEARARDLQLDVRPVAMRNDLHLAASTRMKYGFRECEVDLVHLHTGRANWLGGLAARWAGLPALTTRRMDRSVGRHPMNRLVYRKFVQRAVGIAPAVSDRLREGGVDPAIVSTIWSAVDRSALQPSASREVLRESLGLSNDCKVLLAAAHLTQRKGIDLALRALSHCLAEQQSDAPEVVLWIAGDGPERPALEKLAVELKLGSHVRFLGRREDMSDLLAVADLLMMPSRAEGLGIAALEAMAVGLPVLGCRVGGLGEAVVDERTGVLVPPDDVDALAKGLMRLLEDEHLRHALGREGPVRIDEGFTATQMVAAYESLYAEIVAAGALPGAVR